MYVVLRLLILFYNAEAVLKVGVQSRGETNRTNTDITASPCAKRRAAEFPTTTSSINPSVEAFSLSATPYYVPYIYRCPFHFTLASLSWRTGNSKSVTVCLRRLSLLSRRDRNPLYTGDSNRAMAHTDALQIHTTLILHPPTDWFCPTSALFSSTILPQSYILAILYLVWFPFFRRSDIIGCFL